MNGTAIAWEQLGHNAREARGHIGHGTREAQENLQYQTLGHEIRNTLERKTLKHVKDLSK